MRNFRLVAVLFAGAAVAQMQAQTPDGSLSGLVKADTAVIESKPTLAAWQKAHPAEKSVEPSYQLIEYESQSLWCAASEASISLSNGITVNRLALFYVPSPLGALPAKTDRKLAGRCELLSFWYEVNGAAARADLTDAVARELGTTWGAPEVAARNSRLRHGWGTGYWDPFLYWERETASIVVAIDPRGKPDGPFAGQPRALVITRSPRLPVDQSMDIGAGYTPKGQPRLQQQGYDETARIAHLENPCSFEGPADWREGLITFGEQLLHDYPNSPWAPYVHLILGRTYDAKLQLSYPDGDMAANTNHGPLDPPALRESAILNFRTFLAQKPNDPDAPYARYEAWRLLAGLPPTPIHFGCTGE